MKSFGSSRPSEKGVVATKARLGSWA